MTNNLIYIPNTKYGASLFGVKKCRRVTETHENLPRSITKSQKMPKIIPLNNLGISVYLIPLVKKSTFPPKTSVIKNHNFIKIYATFTRQPLVKAPTLTTMSNKIKPNVLVLQFWFTRFTSLDANTFMLNYHLSLFW